MKNKLTGAIVPSTRNKVASNSDSSMIKTIEKVSNELYKVAEERMKENFTSEIMEERFREPIADHAETPTINHAISEKLSEAGLGGLLRQNISKDYTSKHESVDLSDYVGKEASNLKEILSLAIATMSQSGIRMNNVVIENENYPVRYGSEGQNTLSNKGFILTVEDGETVFAAHPDAVAIAINESSTAVANSPGATAFAIGKNSVAKADADDSVSFAYGEHARAFAFGNNSIAESYGSNSTASASGKNAIANNYGVDGYGL